MWQVTAVASTSCFASMCSARSSLVCAKMKFQCEVHSVWECASVWVVCKYEAALRRPTVSCTNHRASVSQIDNTATTNRTCKKSRYTSFFFSSSASAASTCRDFVASSFLPSSELRSTRGCPNTPTAAPTAPAAPVAIVRLRSPPPPAPPPPQTCYLAC